MNSTTLWNRRFGTLGLRLTIAILSMLLGYYKFFINGMGNEFKYFIGLERFFPIWFLHVVNYYAASVELIAGALLFIGLFRELALYLILSVLVIVTFGHSLDLEVWDINQMVFRMSALLVLLFLPAEWDVFRVDALFPLTRKLGGLAPELPKAR